MTISPAQAQETEAADEYVTAPLCGVDLRVKPITRWRPSYVRALKEADYDGWAVGVLHPEDATRFIEMDPTFDEINEFTGIAMEAAGEAPGKSSGPAKSSRTTRKR
ncbi:hypothetical protein ACFWRC_19410 [Streptomyces albidoflavus]